MQETQTALKNISLKPSNANRIALFVGELNGNLKLIEKSFSVKIFHKGDEVKITGKEKDIKHASDAILDLYNLTKKNIELSKEAVHLTIQSHLNLSLSKKEEIIDPEIQIKTPKKIIRPRGSNQQAYINKINKYEINFGIGDAGTGKTYLAVAKAVEALLSNKVQRIVLIRPAVEAGERLGYLPGDLSQKIDPYLVPLFDSLEYFFGNETLQYLIEKRNIEIVPLAYMRGRTLNNACIILDEAQNSTLSQIKMFLTRLGEDSKMIITGDESQVDLNNTQLSGLKKVRKTLTSLDEIEVVEFMLTDIVRNKIVSKILEIFPKNNE